MKIIFYTIIFLVSCTFLLEAHDEFFKRSPNNSCILIEVTTDYNNGEILTWQLYNNIPIAADWSLDFPFEIFEADVEEDFDNAVFKWNFFTGIDLFEKQDNFGNNVHVQFINNTSIFPMPESQLIYAGTYLKYEEINGKDRILIYSTQCIENGTYTSIFLNDTDGRTFTWRTDDYIPPESFNQMCFEYTVCHELGHVLGLAHCSYEYPESMMHL